jgi:hypothetical protein
MPIEYRPRTILSTKQPTSVPQLPTERFRLPIQVGNNYSEAVVRLERFYREDNFQRRKFPGRSAFFQKPCPRPKPV